MLVLSIYCIYLFGDPSVLSIQSVYASIYLSDLHSLKLTWHLKIDHPKRKLVFQPSIFRGYVSFREGSYCPINTVVYQLIYVSIYLPFIYFCIHLSTKLACLLIHLYLFTYLSYRFVYLSICLFIHLFL